MVYGLVTGGNEESCRFHEAMGCRLTVSLPDCGFKHNHWLSVHWYEKRLCPPVPPEGPPRSASETDWAGLNLTGPGPFSVHLETRRV